MTSFDNIHAAPHPRPHFEGNSEILGSVRIAKRDLLLIAISFAALLIGPVVAGEKGTFAGLIVAGFLCVWRPVPMLFLFIASSGAYFANPSTGGIGLGLTPTRYVALLMISRCLISPGPVGYVQALSQQRGSVYFFISCLVLGLLLGSFVTVANNNYSVSVILVITMITYFLLVGITYQIKSRAMIVLAVGIGLLLPVSYYPLVWSGLLDPIRELRAGAGVDSQALRMAAGSSNLNFIGHLMAPVMPLGIYFFLCSRRMMIKLIAIGLAGMAFAAGAGGGSRVTFAAAFIGVLVAFYAAVRIRGLAAIGASIIMIILSPIVAYVIWGMASGNIMMVYERFMYSEQSHRIPHWIFTIKHILMNPIPDLEGYANTSQIANAHNTYLEGGLVGGWIGLIGMVGLGIVSLMSAFKGFRLSGPASKLWAGALMVMAITVFCSISFNSIIAHKLAWVMIVVLAYKPMYWDYSERPMYGGAEQAYS